MRLTFHKVNSQYNINIEFCCFVTDFISYVVSTYTNLYENSTQGFTLNIYFYLFTIEGEDLELITQQLFLKN